MAHAHNTQVAVDSDAVNGMRMAQVLPDEVQADGVSTHSDESDVEVGVNNSSDIEPTPALSTLTSRLIMTR